ncbi:hypothetical protein C7M84_000968 [Penaeus vannamei]|uniref:MAM domain-containing protein n=1 Tax=Penaeus vannamei TaxID=6689 RepID=A0A423TV14_PENVA|nr:hypothetical protein C7M84_000968 [Penaeus vannamei]
MAIAFLVSHDNHTHQSQQLHLADLDFKVVLPEALNDVGSWLLRCEFEDSLCGWSQPTTEGDYSWVFARASPHARRTGPITGSCGYERLFSEAGIVCYLRGEQPAPRGERPPVALLVNALTPPPPPRFAVFLFGAHVAKVSVHVLQRIGDGTHTAELFHVVGGKGLSWIPTGVTVVEDDLADPRAPLVLVVRATAAPGPEADIALDHVSVLRGACHRDPVLDTNAQESDQPAREDQGACEGLATCTECVSDAATTCSWCDMTQTCLSSTTREAKACLDHLTVHHNTQLADTPRGKLVSSADPSPGDRGPCRSWFLSGVELRRPEHTGNPDGQRLDLLRRRHHGTAPAPRPLGTRARPRPLRRQADHTRGGAAR